MDRYLTVLAIAALLALHVPSADPQTFPGAPSEGHFNDVHYEFRYAIDDPVSGVLNDRWEQRFGEYVKGAYSVLDPDGKVRTVDYEVDGIKGFHAVIRTQYPSRTYLSYDQLTKSQTQHGDPLVNILTNQPTDELPKISQRTGRAHPVIHKDLPPNYHSVSPNYYLSFAKGQKTRYPTPPKPDVSATPRFPSSPAQEGHSPPLEHISPPHASSMYSSDTQSPPLEHIIPPDVLSTSEYSTHASPRIESTPIPSRSQYANHQEASDQTRSLPHSSPDNIRTSFQSPALYTGVRYLGS